MKNPVIWKFNGQSILVKCPRCGEWGRLISKGRTKLLREIKLMVRHDKGTCSIGKCSEHYSELLRIYNECNKAREEERQSVKRITEIIGSIKHET